ncbi:hypothetical protein Gotur_011953, partial [Gossypium turneri]
CGPLSDDEKYIGKFVASFKAFNNHLLVFHHLVINEDPMQYFSLKQWQDSLVILFENFSDYDLKQILRGKECICGSGSYEKLAVGVLMSCIVLKSGVGSYIGELDALRTRLSANIMESKRWNPPSRGWFKINYDGTLVSSIILNKHMPTEFAAEALACLQEIRLGLDLEL